MLVTVVARDRAGHAATAMAAASIAAPSALTRGVQLTREMVGPWRLQGCARGAEVLAPLTASQMQERLSLYPSWGRPSWIPAAPWTAADLTDAANHGGIVPVGGTSVMGYQIPAGTWVVAHRDLSASGLVVEGDCSGTRAAWPGVLFIGCRMRAGYDSPGFLNQNGQSAGGITWVMYCDAGGKSTAKADKCETIFESQSYMPRDHLYVIRSHLSNATTLAFLRNSGDAAIENFGENVTDFGFGDFYHLNGVANSGGQSATLWLRNNLALARVPGSTALTDVVQMAADDGAYLGGGRNLDGSTGYQVRANLLGGAQYTLQLGYDKSNTVSQVRDVHVIDNDFTTSQFPESGEFGIAYKTPDFTRYGNEWSGNRWLDGPNAGKLITAPGASN